MNHCCPLCSTSQTHRYHQDKRRDYWLCSVCDLVFVPSNFHLSQDLEKAEYDKHQNTPNDLGYRKFLSRLQRPLVSKLKAGDKGLDFGCGPGPTLSEIFSEQGWPMNIYDIYYYPDTSVLQRTYDFISMTEVIEHLSSPATVLPEILHMLTTNGWLGIMTKRVTGLSDFKQWHYKNDPTHICFYSDTTFEWIAKKWQLTLEIIGDDVVLLQKTDPR